MEARAEMKLAAVVLDMLEIIAKSVQNSLLLGLDETKVITIALAF